MKIETKIKLKFKDVDTELSIEEIKELKAKLNELLAEHIYIKTSPWYLQYPSYQNPYWYITSDTKFTVPTITGTITYDSSILGSCNNGVLIGSSTDINHPNNQNVTLTAGYNK